MQSYHCKHIFATLSLHRAVHRAAGLGCVWGLRLTQLAGLLPGGRLTLTGHVSTTRANIAGVLVSAIVAFVASITLFALGVLVTDATDPSAQGTPASLVWGASGSVMLIAWAALMWFVARLWGARPGEKGWAPWTCGLFAYSLPALAFALYLFGTGIAIGPRPALIDLASVILGLTGSAAFVGGCLVGLARILRLRPRAGSDYRSA